MTRLMRILFALGLPMVLSPACHALCIASGANSAATYPDLSVTEEFKRSPLVIAGRVRAERNISSADDPAGYAWTVYTVEVLQVFKGVPAPTIRLLSENTSSRFPMDVGRRYLLFISHSPQAEMTGAERLPQDYVDSCGNSASIGAAGPVLKAVRRLAGAK